MKSDKPYISVIIPTYNRAKHLPAALDSVLNQEDSEDLSYEVIVVDDGSSDNTAEVMKRYKDRVIYKQLPKNTGRPAVVRNVGMKMAKGELIAFQDSDDLWTSNKFKSQLGAFDDPEVALSYANCGFIEPDGTIIEGRTTIDASIPINGYAFMRKISKTAAPNPTPTVILRRSVIDKIGLFNEKLVIATDTDYWIRVATVGEFHYCDKVLAYMRRDGSNISSRPDESGDEALYKHETNRVEMFTQLRQELDLSLEEKAALDYRIAELKLDVAAVAKRLGKKTPYDISNVKLPPKPIGLKEVDKLYSTMAFGRAEKALKALLGWSPPLYIGAKNLARKILVPVHKLLKRGS